MAVSQNGWSANDRSVVSSREVPGTNIRLTVRDGAAGTVLIYVAEQFHKRVESISNARGGLDDWGYAERPIRGGGTSLSNHASGTAIDLNATEHPLGAEGTFISKQVQEIEAILEEVKGTVRWGGHYRNRKDEMHFEIDKGFTAVALAAQSLPTQEEDVVPDGPQMMDVQEDLNWINENSGWDLGDPLKVDGYFGSKTLGALEEFRKKWALRGDGRPNILDVTKINRTIHEIKDHNAYLYS